MSDIKNIEVWPIENEPSAFMVKIIRYDGKVNKYKWLWRAPTTHPAQRKRIELPRGFYAEICRLIDDSNRKNEKVFWPTESANSPKKTYDKAAYAHQKKSKAIDAC